MKKQLSKEREAVELFEYAARNLIKEFCDKQDLQFEFDNYDVGIGIICLSDYFFNIERNQTLLQSPSHRARVR